MEKGRISAANTIDNLIIKTRGRAWKYRQVENKFVKNLAANLTSL